MLFIDIKTTNPFYNLALEEYVLVKFEEDVFMLWQNDNTIVVGRNQNTLSEINYEYVKENSINVVRRMSGGGAVYHDLGNLNFTFALNNNENTYFDFATFTMPIIKVLNGMGVAAELSGRNDLVIDDKKFSGNAQYVHKNRILHHGTLLFNSNMSKIVQALNVSKQKIESKGIKSVSSRVTNICNHLEFGINIQAFREKIVGYMLKESDNFVRYEFTPQQLQEIDKLYENKYNTWDWNFGYSPKYTFRKEKKFPSGLVSVEFNVRNDGMIDSAKFYGDFFSRYDVADVEKAFSGIKHNREEMGIVLSGFELGNYFFGIGKDELLNIMI